MAVLGNLNFLSFGLLLTGFLPTTLLADPQYDESHALAMMYLSAGAYAVLPDDCIKRAMPSANKWVKFLAINETCDILSNICSFYTAVSDVRRELVVVFRGTKDKVQLMVEALDSIQEGQDFYGVGKVNQYFFDGLKTLWSGVYKVLSEDRYKDYDVTFTGHSLGGALAALASIITVLNGLRTSDQIKLYTFGEPRVGSSSFAFTLDNLVPHSFRIVNGYDIVPHMPPCSGNVFSQINLPCDPSDSGIGYHHGTEVWYPDGMAPGAEYKICKGSPRNEDHSCSAGVKFNWLLYESYIDAHRHYFDHKIPAFGKLGCAPNMKYEEEILPNDALTAHDPPKPHSTMENLIVKVKSFGNFLKNIG
ncbi:lipase (class 3) domain-containing protein [Ditylenchus destructor]|uniref:Lipase (Class 3) domain-containing protein n=1 Tax=Ditylenchus destructor TaxID=166010 RepID=A0AAD4MTW4_9BILA|nr:lipase (class 3) domain-containing protein [Ditylenchus destructor]